MQQLIANLTSIQNEHTLQGLTPVVISHFQVAILEYYQENARVFPWRETPEPYAVMVSEIMLQQTQADRVVPKFLAFLELFPTPLVLSNASTPDLLGLWQGLGYNRRALNLRRTAEVLVKEYNGKIPSDLQQLLALPGIGPYTAGAIRAFAFDLPSSVIDTNIRRVYLHVFFPDRERVTDKELVPYIDATLYKPSSRYWYSALMDIGHLLPKHVGNANTRSRHYARQGPLVGSNREVRGMLITLLTSIKTINCTLLSKTLDLPTERINPAVAQLLAEGFLEQQGDVLHLAE